MRCFGNKRIVVHPVPAFGDCLFIALLRQHRRFKSSKGDEKEEVQQLRHLIADHLQKDFDRFRGALIMNALATQQEQAHETEDELVGRALSELRTRGSFGGQETIQAFVEIFKCRVEVFESTGTISSFGNDNSKEKLRIFFDPSLVHYEEVAAENFETAAESKRIIDKKHREETKMAKQNLNWECSTCMMRNDATSGR